MNRTPIDSMPSFRRMPQGGRHAKRPDTACAETFVHGQETAILAVAGQDIPMSLRDCCQSTWC